MEEETIVLYPGMAAGHLPAMVQLANRFVEHGFSVTVVTTAPEKHRATNGAISTSPLANPSISFHALPPISLTPANNGNRVTAMYDAIRAYNPKLLAFLTSLSTTKTIRAVVLDFFRTDAIEIARQVGIPVYLFFSPCASVLAIFLHFSVFLSPSKIFFEDLGDVTFNVPGSPPIPASDIPKPLASEEIITNFKKFLDADGIIINSFESLEPRAVEALRGGICVPGHRMPPVYCVGPLVRENQPIENQERHGCLPWLDSQPRNSVVFLCFGSGGAFTTEQIKEIAIGLENSGQKFLWVVCWKNNTENILEPRPEPDLDSLLQEGFLDRTKERGMVLKSWAPQVEVLNHKSIGGFVSHCGWNSTLEAILAGVPMICWPMYAEQSLNKVLLVEEFKVGVVMEGYNKELVRAEEVEVKVRWLMESGGGRKLRERMATVQEKAVEALAEGGPSANVFAAFLRDLRDIHSKSGKAD